MKFESVKGDIPLTSKRMFPIIKHEKNILN
jgi:hypothetical protein